MSKQDGYSSRTAVDLERKYNFGKTFAEVYDLVSEAQRAAQEAQNAFDGLNQEQIFNLLTNFGESQGIYRDDNGDVYVNASYIKGGTIKGDSVKVEAATITGQLVATQIDTKDLKVLAANITGTLTAGQIDTTNLKVSAANITGKLDASIIDTTYLFVDAANITGILSADHIDTDSLSVDAANITGLLTADQIDTDELYVDAANITGTLVAGSLIGGEVALLTAAEQQAGGIDITGSNSSTYAIEMYSNAALRLAAYGSYAAVWIEAGGAAAIGIQTIGSLGYNMTFNRSIMPTGSACYVGRPSYAWDGAYLATDPVITSDRNKKKNIVYGLDRMDGFFDDLMPGKYKLVDGTSGRDHFGFVAQDILENLNKHNIPTTEFAGYVADVDKDGKPTYGLRYGEFIALLVDQVQKLKARVANLEGNKHGQKA